MIKEAFCASNYYSLLRTISSERVLLLTHGWTHANFKRVLLAGVKLLKIRSETVFIVEFAGIKYDTTQSTHEVFRYKSLF